MCQLLLTLGVVQCVAQLPRSLFQIIQRQFQRAPLQAQLCQAPRQQHLRLHGSGGTQRVQLVAAERMQDVAFDTWQPAGVQRGAVAFRHGLQRIARGKRKDSRFFRRTERAAERVSQEGCCLFLLRTVQIVDLVQHEMQPHHVRTDRAEIGDFGLRDGRVGGHDEQRRVTFGQHLQGRIRVVPQR